MKEKEKEKECKLLYSKSKVYIDTGKTKIAGYLALVDRGDDTHTHKDNLLISWLPESLIKEMNEEDKFVLVESTNKITVLINPPPSNDDTYAFSLPIKDVYSLVVDPPSITSWYGTLSINLQGGVTLPVLHFHDDEVGTTALASPRGSLDGGVSYPPMYKSTWGGEEFMRCLKLYIKLLRSQLESSLFLVEPTEMDASIHLQPYLDDGLLDTPSSTPSSRRHGRRTSILHYALSAHASYMHRNTARFNTHQRSQSTGSMRTLFPDNVADATPAVNNLTSVYRNTVRSFAHISRVSKQTAHSMLSHPLAKPIIPHLPTPVQSLAVAAGSTSQGAAGEYDSARIYLAKWARMVAEEGDRNRVKDEELDMVDIGVVSDLGTFELLNVSLILGVVAVLLMCA